MLADPAAGRDAFAWWTRRPGAAAHARALLAMWTEVPWREPFDDDEHALMQQVDADLTAAAAAGGDLVIPYAEWAELVGYLGDAARAATLAAKAGGPSTIGYRRYDMDLEVDAWTLTLPAAFVGRIEDERYWATDGSRAIELHTLETTETDSARLLEVAPELHAVIERLAEPGPGGRFGRVEAHDEGEVHVVHGLIAVAPHVAILTCKGKPSDHAWALATWRSLRLS